MLTSFMAPDDNLSQFIYYKKTTLLYRSNRKHADQIKVESRPCSKDKLAQL